ncbi:hypothetical protein ACLK1Y_17460 [Escherichia coli]
MSDDDAYNSTEQVNAVLLEWSKKAPSFRRLYKEIIHTYPVAENALTHYYIRHFRLKKKRGKGVGCVGNERHVPGEFCISS